MANNLRRIDVAFELNTERSQDLSPILDAIEGIVEDYLANVLPDVEETDYVSGVSVSYSSDQT